MVGYNEVGGVVGLDVEGWKVKPNMVGTSEGETVGTGVVGFADGTYVNPAKVGNIVIGLREGTELVGAMLVGK